MFIAHLKPNAEQSVEDHCKETALIAQSFSKDLGTPNIAYLSGLLHDVGKMCDDFNLYITGQNNFTKGQIDHSFAGAKYISELADKENICYDSSRFIGRIIAAHHGLQDNYDENGTDRFKLRISKDERYNEIRENISDIASDDEIKEILTKADLEYTSIRKRAYALCKKIKDGKNSKTAYAFYLGMFERLMQSVLMDADTINTADFGSDRRTEISDDNSALWIEMGKKLNEKLEGFADKNDTLSLQRRSISQRCFEFASNKVGICRLIVPTGGGKTLSSLRFAIEYCRNNNMKKIFYIAPFMSILDQSSSEIRMIAGDENFLEHHSDHLSNIEDQNELSEYELHTERWDMPVVATTMVQFLNTLFSAKKSSVKRMHQLSGSVIIIDEVQSIPIKCINMFDLAMNFLSEICGCTIVLCSATQPVFDKTDHPIIFDENKSMTSDHSKDIEAFKRTEVIPCIEKYGHTYEEAAEFCYKKFNDAGNILVIVNTKSSASQIYKLMKEKTFSKETVLIHLSTNMCPEHRRKMIDEMKMSLAENKPVICVTTQLIEAGVDISFRCVVRSLAGLDNIAQAAGRCNRHGENNGICPVYTINIRDENLSRLCDIREAQQISRKMIESGKYNDYLSVETLSDYYSLLFRDRGTEMSYKVKDPDTTLLDLLSLNKKWHNIALNSDHDKRHEFSAQAFKTAGQLFEVIDNDTINVIVPYDEKAKEMINELSSDRPTQKISELIRKAQRYSVSIYRGMDIKLKDNNAINTLPCGVSVLNSEFYSNEFGVTAEGSEIEPLIF